LPGTTAPSFRLNLFSLSIDGIGLPGAVGVRGIHFSVSKIPASIGGAPRRHFFDPGALQLDDLQIQVSGSTTGSAATTAQYLNTWAGHIAQGMIDLRDADLRLFSSSLDLVATIHFTNLSPLSALEPFTVDDRRTMTLAQERFELELAP
jgi:hypothetical protein